MSVTFKEFRDWYADLEKNYGNGVLESLGDHRAAEDGDDPQVITVNVATINSKLADIFDTEPAQAGAALLREQAVVQRFLYPQTSLEASGDSSASSVGSADNSDEGEVVGADDGGHVPFVGDASDFNTNYLDDGITVVHGQEVDGCALSALANVVQLTSRPPSKAQQRKLAAQCGYPLVDNWAIDHGAFDVVTLVLRNVLGASRVHVATKVTAAGNEAFSAGWTTMLESAYRADDREQLPCARHDYDRVLLLRPGHWVALRAARHTLDGSGWWLMDSLRGPPPTAIIEMDALDVMATDARAVVCWAGETGDAEAVRRTFEASATSGGDGTEDGDEAAVVADVAAADGRARLAAHRPAVLQTR